MFPEQNRQRVNMYIGQKRSIAGIKYADWLDLTNVEFKLMSEQEWLATCAYFDGCAICGEEYIETREFFVKFVEGGRYASWNMFPMCSNCATKVRLAANPFIWLDDYLGAAKKLGLTEERKQKLLEYFILQIERMKANDAGASQSV